MRRISRLYLPRKRFGVVVIQNVASDFCCSLGDA